MNRRRFLGSLLGTLAFGFLPFSFLAAKKKKWEPPAAEVWAAASLDVLKQQLMFGRIVRRDFEKEGKPETCLMSVEDFISLEAQGLARRIQIKGWQVSLLDG